MDIRPATSGDKVSLHVMDISETRRREEDLGATTTTTIIIIIIIIIIRGLVLSFVS